MKKSEISWKKMFNRFLLYKSTSFFSSTHPYRQFIHQFGFKKSFHRFYTVQKPNNDYANALKAFKSARRVLLQNVPGFWPRMKLRARLFLTGHPSKRPLKMDHLLAFFSWVFVGHSIFILVATTTFVSLFVVVINSLQFQGL